MLGCSSPNRTISGNVTTGLGVGFWNTRRRVQSTVTLLMTLSVLSMEICSAAPHSTSATQSHMTSSVDDIRLFGAPTDRIQLTSTATVAVEDDVTIAAHFDRLPKQSAFSRSSPQDGAAQKAYVSSKVAISRTYQLYSRCSNKYIRVAGRHIDALGSPDDNYAQLEFITDNFHSRLRIRSVQSRDFICFNRIGRPIVKTGGSDPHCIFRELNSADDFTELVSVVNDRWYLGFDRHGRRLNASVSESYQPSTSQLAAATLSAVVLRPTDGSSSSLPLSIRPTAPLSGKRNRKSKSSRVEKPLTASTVVVPSRRRSRHTVQPALPLSTSTSPSTIATTTARQTDLRHPIRHSRQRQLQQQLLLQEEQQAQLHQRVRHHHKQQRQRQCFQFVKTEISTTAPNILPALIGGRYVVVDARRTPETGQVNEVDSGRESPAVPRPPSAVEDDAVNPLTSRSGVGGGHSHHHRHQGPPVNFGKVYTNFGVISLHPPYQDIRPGDGVDPT